MTLHRFRFRSYWPAALSAFIAVMLPASSYAHNPVAVLVGFLGAYVLLFISIGLGATMIAVGAVVFKRFIQNRTKVTFIICLLLLVVGAILYATAFHMEIILGLLTLVIAIAMGA